MTALAARNRVLDRTFLRHLAEMIAAMVIGMVVLGPLWPLPAGPAARPDVAALVSAVDMAVAMAVWMAYRGHTAGAVAEMAAAMSAPFLILLIPWWAGLIPGPAVMIGGHVLMLPAMVLVMLRRAGDHPVRRTGWAARLIARWPTALALLITVDNLLHPRGLAPVMMLVLPVAYLVIGAVRRTLRPRRILLLQVAGLLGYALLALAALAAGPALGNYLVGAGWLVHAGWDYWHHRRDLVVPRAYAEWCGVLDTVVGVSVIAYATTL
jgi:hypothetical protein